MAETTEILVVALLTALAVVLALFAYTGWTKFKRYQLRRSMRY
jgi:hypothetical protein